MFLLSKKIYRHTADFFTYVVSLIADLVTSIYDRIVSKPKENTTAEIDNPASSDELKIDAFANDDGYVTDPTERNEDKSCISSDKSKIYTFLQDSKQLIDSIKVDKDELNVLNIGKSSIVQHGIFTDAKNNKNTPIAIKKMDKTYENNTEERFIREVENLLKVQQDSRFIQIIAAYETPNYYYIATNIHGIDIINYINILYKDGKTLDTNIALYIIFSVLDHLEFCIQNNILHTDTHLQNILLSEEGVKHCDLADATYRSNLTPDDILIMINIIENHILVPLRNAAKIYNNYKTTILLSEKEKSSLFKKHFESKLKDNPKMTEKCIERMHDRFMGIRSRAHKCSMLNLWYYFAIYLYYNNLMQSSLTTMTKAWIDYMKIELHYQEPMSFAIPNIKKLNEKQAVKNQLDIRREFKE